MQDDPAYSEAERWLGTTLRGKYRLDKVLGLGGMAVVYQATHRNGSRVAIKMLQPESAQDRELVQRFLKEGYAANAVEHDGVVRVHDDDITDDGRPFVVMELLEGVSLDELRVQHAGKIVVGWAIALVYQLLDVLAAAHEKGIVHRDIKPGNLFLTKKGELKVLDFGIARYRQAGGQRTMTRMAMGTPDYAAPEQMFGRQDLVDARADLYAAGGTLFHLASGELPRSDTGVMRSFARVVPGCEPSLAAVIDRALRDQREERWPDARSMQNALSAAYQRIEGVAIPEGGAGLAQMRYRASKPPDRPYTPSAGMLEIPAGARVPTEFQAPAPGWDGQPRTLAGTGPRIETLDLPVPSQSRRLASPSSKGTVAATPHPSVLEGPESGPYSRANLDPVRASSTGTQVAALGVLDANPGDRVSATVLDPTALGGRRARKEPEAPWEVGANQTHHAMARTDRRPLDTRSQQSLAASQMRTYALAVGGVLGALLLLVGGYALTRTRGPATASAAAAYSTSTAPSGQGSSAALGSPSASTAPKSSLGSASSARRPAAGKPVMPPPRATATTTAAPGTAAPCDFCER